MDLVNDATLERELERALAVDPSPAFVARVRMQIAEEPLPSPRRFGWRFAATAGMAAAASAAALFVALRPGQRVEPAVARLSARPLAAPLSAFVPTSPRLGHERRTTNVERPTANDAHRTTNDERLWQEPLFDTRETIALQRLIAGVREARVDLTPLTNGAPMPLPSLDDLVIPPIAIQPLDPGGTEGERP
jgi:hypothetical protein